jgi:hypothetical protein
MADPEIWALSKATDHVHVAEMLLVASEDTNLSQDRRDRLVEKAQVHATLAGAVAQVLELVVKRSALDVLNTDGATAPLQEATP